MWPCGSMKLPPVYSYSLHLKCINCANIANTSRYFFIKLDRPLTDLHETEGTGGFPGVTFKARPVVGGHFAFLSLGRACEGNALAALKFLDMEEIAEEREVKEL